MAWHKHVAIGFAGFARASRHHLLGSAALVVLATAAGTAHADEKLNYGPAGDWVKPAALAPLNKAQLNAPVQFQLYDTQLHFGADGDSRYSEYAVHIQTPAGLQGIQPVAVWDPEKDTVTIHKVQIVRGDQVIDLLKTLNFTVLRRETNLEKSMLDGALTAVMPPEGLQVGDTLVFAMTIRHNDPVLKGRSEAVLGASGSFPIGHTEVRVLWDGTKPIRTQQSDDLPPARTVKTASGQAYVLDLHDVVRPDPPLNAPSRFGALGEVEFTQFSGWEEVSTLLAPLYAKAATLAPASPLKAEAARIRAASADPKVRAAMALHLVQDQVRYLFLGMNLGGYVPADADLTWTRRFGDCKGKTVLLLALLHELDIKAEPALVSTTNGDGLDGHLPMLEWFDHVMVRAEIGGKTYWLDGTRLDDRDVDSIQVPNFGFALPLRDKGGALEALKPAPLDVPNEEILMTLDASAGLDVPAKAHFVEIDRGDEAIDVHESLDAMAGPAQEKALRDYWAKSYGWIAIQKVSATYDKKTGIETMTMDGAANMEWNWDDATRTWRYETDNTRLGWESVKARQPGPHSDAPFKLLYPVYYHNHEDILLPKGGKGFAVDGETVDKALGGSTFKRTIGIHDGVLSIDASKRSLVPEITAAEEASDLAVLNAMYQKGVFLVAPEGYKAGAGENAKLAGDTTRSAADMVNEGDELAQQGKIDQAQGRYNQALALDPGNARALVGRAYVFYRRNAYAAALADLQQALKRDPAMWQAYDLMAAIYVDQDKPAEAIDAYSQALRLYPNDTDAMAGRAALYGAAGDYARAGADAQAALQIDPGNSAAVRVMFAVETISGKTEEARALVRKALDINPDDADLHMLMAQADEDCSDRTEAQCEVSRADAVVEYGKVIAIAPSAEAYAARAQVRPEDELQARLDDINQAIKMAPQWNIGYLERAAHYLYVGDTDKALADANQAIALDPKEAQGYSIREQVYFAQGKTALALADVDRLVADHPDEAQYLNESCWARATHGIELDKALAACNAAVKLAPKSAAILDSRGFVQLRLGHYDEAIADYDAVLALAPDQVGSLYCRGIAKLRKGMKTQGQADIDAARKLYPKIDEVFAGYGVKP